MRSCMTTPSARPIWDDLNRKRQEKPLSCLLLYAQTVLKSDRAFRKFTVRYRFASCLLCQKEFCIGNTLGCRPLPSHECFFAAKQHQVCVPFG